MGGVRATDETSEVAEAFTRAAEEGLDPAFDEIGELFDHVDDLSRWMRFGRAHPRQHDD